MQKFVLATVLVASVLASAVSAQAQVKYYKPGVFEIGTFFDNLQSGG